MCGIAGAIGYGKDDLHANITRRMTEVQTHRGPDAEGFWEWHDGEGFGVALGHRRLAIIDLNPESNQPMVDPDTGNAITFNGEIYNYKEIRAELNSLGQIFRTNGDTEVILKAYAAWGRNCLERLHGMFAFVIWDAQERTGFAARDRLGIKPLYWFSEGAVREYITLFASELRAILNSDLFTPTLKTDGVAQYLWNGFVPGPGTLVHHVHLLPAGSFMTIFANGRVSKPQRYWSLPAQSKTVTTWEEFERTALKAIQYRMIADVPVGVFLSGGVDSSVVAALAAKEHPEPIRTFTVTFDEAEFNEAPYAKAVADAIGSVHTEIPLSPNYFHDALEGALDAIDQPSFDLLNTYIVSKAVAESGIKVALSGLGGDELFGGYTSFKQLPALQRLGFLRSVVPDSILQRVGGMIARARMGTFGEVPPQTNLGKLGDALCAGSDLEKLYQVSYGLYTADFIRKLFPRMYEANAPYGWPTSRKGELDAVLRDSDALHSISTLELRSFVTERLLRDTDVASMASALEVRVPLIDHRLIEVCAGLPESERFHPLGKKNMLKRLAATCFDTSILERPKAGFELPLQRWCRGELSQAVADTLHDKTWVERAGLNPHITAQLWRSFSAGAPGMYWSRVWAIYVLVAWTRKHCA